MSVPTHPACLARSARAAELIARRQAVRARTLAILEIVDSSDRLGQIHPDFSPIRWHWGHLIVYEAHWVLRVAGGLDPGRDEWNHAFDPRHTAKADRVHLPDETTLFDYAQQVDQRIADLLDRWSAGTVTSPLLENGYILDLVREHECQHQEIMLMLIAFLPPNHKTRPASWSEAPTILTPQDRFDWVEFPGGSFLQGDSSKSFAWDNERPAHEATVPCPFALARQPVSESLYAAFLEDDGYQRPEFWSAEGWRWRDAARVTGPARWLPPNSPSNPSLTWWVRDLFEDRPLRPDRPVVGLSKHEAEAFACWAGVRLPTESEWEGAARRTDLRSNQPGLEALGAVWEWTASPFAPYPGFQPYPYEGYSQAWFDHRHFVLRGGSWATHPDLLRPSFRNWYLPEVRQALSGLRPARLD
jgi:iron(II)-dependent oxidoreductase